MDSAFAGEGFDCKAAEEKHKSASAWLEVIQHRIYKAALRTYCEVVVAVRIRVSRTALHSCTLEDYDLDKSLDVPSSVLAYQDLDIHSVAVTARHMVESVLAET